MLQKKGKKKKHQKINFDVKLGRVLGIALISTSVTASLNEQSNLCWR